VAASVEFTVVERRGARSEAEQAIVEVEREISQKVMEERRVGYENIYTESKEGSVNHARLYTQKKNHDLSPPFFFLRK
jgi:PP-loop superfamily ATP-utilizing enzyme